MYCFINVFSLAWSDFDAAIGSDLFQRTPVRRREPNIAVNHVSSLHCNKVHVNTE